MPPYDPRVPEPSALRAEFPVLENTEYLNAGTCGPIPRAAVDAARAELVREVEAGRSGEEHYAHLRTLWRDVRSQVAELLGSAPESVALTGSTTDGVNTVLRALELGPGDEVLTSDEEHPGLLAPLAAARAQKGFELRFVPFEEVPGEGSPKTRLIACSHVSWVTGRVLDVSGLSESAPLVLLDGAQGLGAVPTSVQELGCDFYAASGQKWVCGPDHSGYLYVRQELAEELPAPWPNYLSLSEPSRALALLLHPDARRFDTGVMPGPATAWARASLQLLAEHGWDPVRDRAATLADELARRLTEAGLSVAPRGRSTLVSWEAADAAAEVKRLAAAGFAIRDLPGRGLVRASVGAWTSEDAVERLAVAAS
jgi:L-cysteine/cystine lyase